MRKSEGNPGRRAGGKEKNNPEAKTFVINGKFNWKTHLELDFLFAIFNEVVAAFVVFFVSGMTTRDTHMFPLCASSAGS